MGPITWFLFVYLLGGVTFLPLLLAFCLHAFTTIPSLPPDEQSTSPADDPAAIKRLEDEKLVLRTATDDLAEKFHRKHESDVAAGYFAVCREFVPGGVNGKPPDKISPAGEVVATESPSVYQSMYRSIFDRSQKPTLEPNMDPAGKPTKRANNVFYVVLRHGHLMLYEDIQQLEVRYVISLEYHDVDLYSGGEHIPEGELWIKKNSIRLKRKETSLGEGAKSLPFFLFSESLSEKEDFYFALLKNQEKKMTMMDGSPPEPQLFDVRDMVTLVQKLHSSEEHLQTRWLNALMGRLFLAMYKTPQLEDFLRNKLHKKISRVKKPTFITKLALRKIEPGDGAPFITNPRLKDLTVNGDCTVEADVKYTGHFKIEIAATARIDLGTRFKAREVDLVLAVVCNRLEGHALVRFKPPPSNRIWFTFEKMPNLELAVKPIVSSRQITLTIILKAIESRIREVFAESIVLPFWDDIPFLDTTTEAYRGGIWKKAAAAPKTTEIQNEDPEDEAEAGSGTQTPAEVAKMLDERTLSMPALPASREGPKLRSGKMSVHSTKEALSSGPSTSAERLSALEAPPVLRSSSVTTAADPIAIPNHIDAENAGIGSDVIQTQDAASSMLKDFSARSLTASPTHSPIGSTPNESAVATALKDRSLSSSSKNSTDSPPKSHITRNSTSSSVLQTPNQSSYPPSPVSGTFDRGLDSAETDAKSMKTFASAARSLTGSDRKLALAQITAATVAAQKWGWGVLNKNKQQKDGSVDGPPDSRPDVPMGRGRPLPPPGMPLPPPERSNTKGSLGGTAAMPKRKPLPPPLLPKRTMIKPTESEGLIPGPRLPLPERRQRQSLQTDEEQAGEVLVVEAPTESAPTSPASEEHRDEFFGHTEEGFPYGTSHI